MAKNYRCQTWTFNDLQDWCETLGYGFKKDRDSFGRNVMIVGNPRDGRIKVALMPFAKSYNGGVHGVLVSADRNHGYEGQSGIYETEEEAAKIIDVIAKRYGIEKSGQLSLWGLL